MPLANIYVLHYVHDSTEDDASDGLRRFRGESSSSSNMNMQGVGYESISSLRRCVFGMIFVRHDEECSVNDKSFSKTTKERAQDR
jgi:hypothetical protein